MELHRHASRQLAERLKRPLVVYRQRREVAALVKHPPQDSAFASLPLKSPHQLARDLAWWRKEYGRVGRDFFSYGLEREGRGEVADYVPYRVFRAVRDRSNRDLIGRDDYNYACITEDKFVFAQFLSSLGYPTPRNLALLSASGIEWLNPRRPKIPLEALWSSDLEVDAFCKPVAGMRGDEAFPLRASRGVVSIGDQAVSPQDLKRRLAFRLLLQERVTQHPMMASLHPESINTLRLVTVAEGDSATPLTAALRVGSGGSFVDNWAHGGIIVRVDFNTGQPVGPALFKKRHDHLTHHPDSSVEFATFTIPFFDEAVELACRLQTDLYGFHSVGWDIAITPDGPSFIEGNDNWGGYFAMAYDPGFTKRYFDTLDGGAGVPHRHAWLKGPQTVGPGDHIASGRVIRRMKSRLRKVVRHWPIAIGAVRMTLDRKQAISYYPESERKSTLEIVGENVRWALHHGEINRNYFAYGLDRKGADPADYIAHGQAMRLIAARNRAMSGGTGAGDDTRILRDKRAFSELAARLGYPTPRTLGIADADGIDLLDPPCRIAFEELTAREGFEAFCKPVGGHGGRDAFLLSVRRGRVHIDDQEAAPGALTMRVTEPMMLQERIVQHEMAAALHPASINTVRLVTVLCGAKARPFAAAQRIGAGGARVDNWAAGGLVVRVDLETCILRGRGFFKGGKGRAVTHHPDTGLLLDGHPLPGLREGIALACNFHQDIGRFHTIGWDLALTPTGPSIVEANTHWDEGIHLAVDEGFGPRLLALEPH